MILWLRPLVFIDCVLNVLLGGSINETLSSRAHRMRVRHQPYWFWMADAIDWIFATFFRQADHCHRCYEDEVATNGALFWLGLHRT